jgi:hypothetical protein
VTALVAKFSREQGRRLQLNLSPNCRRRPYLFRNTLLRSMRARLEAGFVQRYLPLADVVDMTRPKGFGRLKQAVLLDWRRLFSPFYGELTRPTAFRGHRIFFTNTTRGAAPRVFHASH